MASLILSKAHSEAGTFFLKVSFIFFPISILSGGEAFLHHWFRCNPFMTAFHLLQELLAGDSCSDLVIRGTLS